MPIARSDRASGIMAAAPWGPASRCDGGIARRPFARQRNIVSGFGRRRFAKTRNPLRRSAPERGLPHSRGTVRRPFSRKRGTATRHGLPHSEVTRRRSFTKLSGSASDRDSCTGGTAPTVFRRQPRRRHSSLCSAPLGNGAVAFREAERKRHSATASTHHWRWRFVTQIGRTPRQEYPQHAARRRRRFGTTRSGARCRGCRARRTPEPGFRRQGAATLPVTALARAAGQMFRTTGGRPSVCVGAQSRAPCACRGSV